MNGLILLVIAIVLMLVTLFILMLSDDNPPDDMDGMARELLALLDRIEIEEDLSLTTQRFDIVEKFGITVEIGEKLSGRMQ